MARPRDRTLYQCVEPFAVFNRGIPEVYGANRMVLFGDPILRTHPLHFVLAADRVEQASAFPGERRSVIPPVIETEIEEIEEDAEEV